MTRPLVSFVIAAKNAEDTIQEALQSAAAQTIRDLEVVVVDDASRDATGEKIDEMAKRDSRIRALHLKRSVGAGEARNMGVRQARGRFIAIMDSDDISEPTRIEEQIRSMEKGEAKAAGSWARVEFFTGEEIGILRTPRVLEQGSWRRFMFRAFVPVVHPSLIVERELFLRAGAYPSFARAEDYLFLLNLLRLTPIVNVQSPLYIYRREKLGLKKYRLSQFYNLKGNLRFIREHGLGPGFYASLAVPLAKMSLPGPVSWLEALRWKRGQKGQG